MKPSEVLSRLGERRNSTDPLACREAIGGTGRGPQAALIGSPSSALRADDGGTSRLSTTPSRPTSTTRLTLGASWKISAAPGALVASGHGTSREINWATRAACGSLDDFSTHRNRRLQRPIKRVCKRLQQRIPAPGGSQLMRGPYVTAARMVAWHYRERCSRCTHTSSANMVRKYAAM